MIREKMIYKNIQSGTAKKGSIERIGKLANANPTRTIEPFLPHHPVLYGPKDDMRHTNTQ